MDYYIASCIFTERYPDVSDRIQKYIKNRYGMEIVRCCVPKYKLSYFEERMPDRYKESWASLPDCADFSAGDTVYALCHNCLSILEETKPQVAAKSLWELILEDDSFVFPDYKGMEITIQDCWRSKGRRNEQESVRALLAKMNINVRELKDNYDDTDFCGASLYRPSPKRNLQLAPIRYVQNAKGKFEPHTSEEQEAIMKEYCKQFETDTVVAYCHYCTEGLKLGGVNTKHIAELLF